MSFIVKAALPLAAFGLVVFVVGGSAQAAARKKKKHEEVPDETIRPISDKMVFDDGCNNLVVRVQSDAYDKRITDQYWVLRGQGVTDPVELSAGVLRMDAPQCQWPPLPGSSLRSKQIWDLVHHAVENYWAHELAGTLAEYAGIFGSGGLIE